MGFTLCFVLPGLLALGAFAGSRGEHGNLWAGLPLAVVYLLVPLVNGVRGSAARVETDRRPEADSAWLPPLVPLVALPVQLAALWIALAHLSSGALGGWGCLLWTVSTGVVSALFAVNVAHELMHRPSRLERALSVVLLSTVCFGVFKVVHLRVHHLHVATPLDPSSAERGQNLYRFLLAALPATFANGFSLERRRLAATGRSLLTSELTAGYALSALWLCVAWAAWGWVAGGFFLAQSVLAMVKLEWMNFLQHYGLTRAVDASGRPEPVARHHAWSQEHRVSNLAMLNLLRHGAHHVDAGRPYHRLRAARDVPCYPLDFSLMFLVSLVPPLFRAVVHPVLDRSEWTRRAPEAAPW